MNDFFIILLISILAPILIAMAEIECKSYGQKILLFLLAGPIVWVAYFVIFVARIIWGLARLIGEFKK